MADGDGDFGMRWVMAVDVELKHYTLLLTDEQDDAGCCVQMPIHVMSHND